MKPVELFGVVVRSVGLLLTLSAMAVLFYALLLHERRMIRRVLDHPQDEPR